MKVIGLSSKIEVVLKITKLYQVFPEFPDEEAALRNFRRPERSHNRKPLVVTFLP